MVAFYISGHGFGHASRQIEIINALSAHLHDRVPILVRTAAARWLFDRTLRTPVTFLPGDTDTGVVQIDSLRLDEAATVRAAREFYSTFHQRVEDEAARLRAHDVRLVIADAPPLGCAAAASAGLPSIVISNFTWDWIYEGYADRFGFDAPEVLPVIRDAYAQATEGWRLPMGGGFATFGTPRHLEAPPRTLTHPDAPRRTLKQPGPVMDLPFVARHATKPRDEVLTGLGLPLSRPLVLSSFGGYGVDGLDLHSLDCLDTWTVVITGRTEPSSLPPHVAFIDERRIYERGMRYEDLVAAVDVVATKPGYGIISECIANDTAILYTSRGRFPEYDVMVREMPRYLRCAYIDQESLLAGRWFASLDHLLGSHAPPARPATDGADIVAELIVRRYRNAEL